MKKPKAEESEKVDSRYVYSMLPKTNCKECGEINCDAFAKKVVSMERKIEECPTLLRKRQKAEETEKKRLLNALRLENRVFKKEEAFVKANNYGEVISRFFWPSLTSQKNLNPLRHIIITTKGLALENQQVYPLKKKWDTLKPGRKAYPIKKVIDYNKKEVFTGLIPFKSNSHTSKLFLSSPFSFEIKQIEEQSQSDNQWITAMSGSSGIILLGFDKNIPKDNGNYGSEHTAEIGVIEIPLDKQYKSQLDSLTNLLQKIKKKSDKNESLDKPEILNSLRKRYSRKFELEESLRGVEKRLARYQLLAPREKAKVAKTPSKISIKKAGTKNKHRIKAKRGYASEKAEGNLIAWDTTHYEALRWEIEIKELIETIQKTTNSEVHWLKGDWRDQLLSNKKLLEKTRILVLTGLSSKDKISSKELSAVKNFVKEGGSLFLSPPLFKGEDTNSVSSLFGAEFLWNKITDQENHEGKHSDHVIICDFSEHQVCEGVKGFCFGDYGGFPLKIEKRVKALAFTSNKAQPPNAPVLATTQYGKGSIVFSGSSTAFKDKYLNMYDNKTLIENIFSFLAAPLDIASEPSQKEQKTDTLKMPIEKKPSAIKKSEVEEPKELVAKIPVKFPAKPGPIKAKPPEEIISKPKEFEKTSKREVPAEIKDVARQIDKLDEKLVFGEIDEVTYEIEKAKVKSDFEGLTQLMIEGRISLSKYVEARSTILSRIKKKPHTVNCSSCGEILLGIERFCPSCGEKCK